MFTRICHLLLCTVVVGWVLSKDLEQTQPELGTLTEKQLLIQRWFSSLTYLQDSSSWDGWGDAVTDLNCDGNSCIRYEISGLAYAAAVLASKTPAYIDVSAKILYDSIMRMIQKPVWQYIELFDDFQSQPSYPDPVAYKNIMYSGHLAQMIALYESITGNMTFSIVGWQFSWGADSEYPDLIPYTSRKLLQAIYNQTSVYEGALGGVPCEPDSIFVICNNYPMNAFLLYDQLHNTTYAEAAVGAWQNTVEKHGVNRLPDVDGADNNYFNLDYLIHPLGIWEPLASVGSDMWALSWMPTWWDYSTPSSTTLLQDAYNSVLHSSQWILTPATNNTPAQAHLHPGDLGNKLFPFNDAITTSFFPMIYKQFSAAASAAALLEQVYAYFDANYGHYFDSDGDGVQDSFQYNTALANCSSPSLIPSNNTFGAGAACETGDYSVWVTSNVLIGSLLPSAAQSADYLRNLFRGKPLYLQSMHKPKVEEVSYPHVMVSRAEFVVAETSAGDAMTNVTCACPTAGLLHFTLQPGDNAPTDSHTVMLSSGCDVRSSAISPDASTVLSPCTQSTAELESYLQLCTTMTLRGEPFTSYKAGAASRGQGYIEVTAPGWTLAAGARSARDDALPFVMHFRG